MTAGQKVTDTNIYKKKKIFLLPLLCQKRETCYKYVSSCIHDKNDYFLYCCLVLKNNKKDHFIVGRIYKVLYTYKQMQDNTRDFQVKFFIIMY